MMVLGAAWSGRLPVTQKIQTGSIPVSTANYMAEYINKTKLSNMCYLQKQYF